MPVFSLFFQFSMASLTEPDCQTSPLGEGVVIIFPVSETVGAFGFHSNIKLPRPKSLCYLCNKADGNCKKVAQVRQHIQQEVASKGVNIPHLVCAVPNPHIERWYLEDQQAFKKVLPKAQPEKLRYECERDRYKKALIEVIRAAGVEPLLGGAEYGEDIAKILDTSGLDRSFNTFSDVSRSPDLDTRTDRRSPVFGDLRSSVSAWSGDPCQSSFHSPRRSQLNSVSLMGAAGRGVHTGCP